MGDVPICVTTSPHDELYVEDYTDCGLWGVCRICETWVLDGQHLTMHKHMSSLRYYAQAWLRQQCMWHAVHLRDEMVRRASGCILRQCVGSALLHSVDLPTGAGHMAFGGLACAQDADTEVLRHGCAN